MTDVNEALKIVRAAGYRVSKPKAKKAWRVGPTCVVQFSDGQVCRMSTHTDDSKPDFKRGIALCVAAHESRTRHFPTFAQPVAAHFERDGVVIATQ